MEKCECCGKEIKRGYGKVCASCERKVFKNLKKSEKALVDYLLRTK